MLGALRGQSRRLNDDGSETLKIQDRETQNRDRYVAYTIRARPAVSR